MALLRPHPDARYRSIFNWSHWLVGTLAHVLSSKLYFIHRTINTESNDLRITICWRKSEVTVIRISDCNVIEKWMEHGIHCPLCYYTGDVIDLLS